MAQVVFMGSPEYAIPSLRALHAHHQVVLVVTQPDRRQGRGHKMSAPPVKDVALEYGLDVWQPTTLRSTEAMARLGETGADVYVTAAIGLLIPPKVLALPAHGCLNLHASLLPRWRGAAPIAFAILHGDEETGVTLMQTEKGLDTGPIVAQVRCPILAGDTTATLTPRLAQAGARLLVETLPAWLAGQIEPCPQPQEGVTLARRLVKADGQIDWTQPATLIERSVRAYTPWPGAYTTYQGRNLRILRAGADPEWQSDKRPGTVIALQDGRVVVATGQGALVLRELQLAGKKAMPIEVFCRGQRAFAGSTLGRASHRH
jgi:methionyl-tRNA formyltransferase